MTYEGKVQAIITILQEIDAEWNAVALRVFAVRILNAIEPEKLHADPG